MRAMWASLACGAAALAALTLPAAAQEDTQTCVPGRSVGCPTPTEIIAAANAAARVAPSREAFAGARQVYAYEAGAIYELYASPLHVSAILLEPGEAVTAIAAGDTSRWMVSESEAESEREPRAVVLVKPRAGNLATNIVIVTARRTYLIEARAESGLAYTAEIAWSYPAAVSADEAPRTDQLRFDYRVRTVRGRTPVWIPVRIFDDGRRTWIEFPPETEAADLPPLFVITPEGAELVNYRVAGRRMIVDRIFERAELRLGVNAPAIVRIERGAHTDRRRVRRGGRP